MKFLKHFPLFLFLVLVLCTPFQAYAQESATTQGLCCACQSGSGDQTRRDFFRIADIANCANFSQSASVRGSRSAADFSGITCQEAATCQNPKTAEQLYSTLVSSPSSNQPEASASATRDTGPIIPRLAIQIPGLSFSAPQVDPNVSNLPFLPQYIAGVYRYAVSIVALLATVMIIYGGFRYLVGSTSGDIGKGKEIITDAVVGMVLTLGAYALLATVNPDLVSFRPLELVTIREIPFAGTEQVGQINREEASEQPPAIDRRALSTDRPTRNAAINECFTGSPIGPLQRFFVQENNVVIPIQSYLQFESPWGRLAYGGSLVANDASCAGSDSRYCRNEPVCPNETAGNPVNQDACATSFEDSACGPTSLAVLLASFGFRTTDPARASLNEHLYDPIDAAKFAIRTRAKRFSVHDSGPSAGMTRWDGTSQSVFEDVARIGPFASQVFSRNQRVRERGVVQWPATILNQVTNFVRSGYPVAFLCTGCHVEKNTGRNSRNYAGHYMVLHGVNESGTVFKALDVGSRFGPNSYISLDQLKTQTLGFYVVQPRELAGTTQPSPLTLRRCPPLSATSAPINQDTSANPGPISFHRFTWRPPGGSTSVYPDNVSYIAYPQALETIPNVPVHAYIFIPGNNDGSLNTNSETTPLFEALRSVAGSKNIVVMIPNKVGNYFPNYDVTHFYQTAQAALRTHLPQGFTITDVVVGGHSGATCNGRAQGAGGVPLALAAATPLTGQNAVIAYDGCAGSALTGQNFNPAGQNVFINSDHGQNVFINSDQQTNSSAVHRSFDLSESTCPPCVQAHAQGLRGCYSKQEGVKQILSIETGVGHADSRLPMNKIMFCSLFPNQRNDAPSTAASNTCTDDSLNIFTFNYHPSNAWSRGQNVMVAYPKRLENQTAPVNAFVFLHGLGAGANPFTKRTWTLQLRAAMQQYASSKNFIFIFPAFDAPVGDNERLRVFFQSFRLNNFWEAAISAINGHVGTRSLQLQELVVGGHSSGTCQGPLNFWTIPYLPASIPLKAILAYDGCAGRSNFSNERVSAPGKTMFFSSPERPLLVHDAEVRSIRRMWNIEPGATCPAYVTDSSTRCEKNPSEDWWIFHTSGDHDTSIRPMTRYALQHLFPDATGAASSAPDFQHCPR